MKETSDADACAEIVRRDDPHLYAAALFAPEPARSDLMVIYAFDCELGRASRASKESMIPRMRLQWWRDAVGEALEGAPAKSHEVARPLAGLLDQRPALLSDDLNNLIKSHEAWLDIDYSADSANLWKETRYQSLVAMACTVLSGGAADAPAVGSVLADAFVLRNLVRLSAGQARALMPGISGVDAAALSRGTLTAAISAAAVSMAQGAQDRLDHARSGSVPRKIVPALLPVLWAERALRLVRRDPAAIFGQLNDIDRPFDGMRLAWRAGIGRW